MGDTQPPEDQPRGQTAALAIENGGLAACQRCRRTTAPSCAGQGGRRYRGVGHGEPPGPGERPSLGELDSPTPPPSRPRLVTLGRGRTTTPGVQRGSRRAPRQAAPHAPRVPSLTRPTVAPRMHRSGGEGRGGKHYSSQHALRRRTAGLRVPARTASQPRPSRGAREAGGGGGERGEGASAGGLGPVPPIRGSSPWGAHEGAPGGRRAPLTRVSRPPPAPAPPCASRPCCARGGCGCPPVTGTAPGAPTPPPPSAATPPGCDAARSSWSPLPRRTGRCFGAIR